MFSIWGNQLAYKINELKLIIMGLNITTEIQTQIRGFDSTPWRSIVKYLEINIKVPLDKAGLTDLNITPVIKDICWQTEGWSSLQR